MVRVHCKPSRTALLSVFNFLDGDTKRVTLLLWSSASFLVYLGIAFVDNTDYVALERADEDKLRVRSHAPPQ